MNPKVNITYRPDLDGLRAIAIIGVLLFHLDKTYFPGGFLGVDVFFVLSGFLITSIIIRELDEGRFGLVRFFERRMRRIYPAMLVLFVASMAAGWVWLLPSEWLFLNSSLVRAVCGISNIYFEKHLGGYFGIEPSDAVLLHTWSLGVEMQFYALFPVLLLILYRSGWSRRWLAVAAGALLTGSWILCWYKGRVSQTECFFLPQYRVWQLLIGAVIALAPLRRLSTGWARAVGLLGFFLVAGGLMAINESSLLPGVSALLPCVGVGFLIIAGYHEDSWANRLLSWRPLVFLGLISYSVYLWHWPLMVFAKILLPEGLPVQAGLLLASLLCGWLSWRFIERPFRDPVFINRRKLFVICGTASLLLVGVGGYIFKKTDGFPTRFSAEVQKYIYYREKQAAFLFNLSEKTKRNFDPSKSAIYGDKTQVPSIALWGDSHAMALLPVLDKMAREHAQALRGFTIVSQAPLPGWVRADAGKDGGPLLNYKKQVIDFLLENNDLRVVILHARWLGSVRGTANNRNLEYIGVDARTPAELDVRFADSVRSLVGQLLAAGKRVVIIYPVPEARFNVGNFLARRMDLGRPELTQVPYDHFYHDEKVILDIFDGLPANPQLLRLKPHEKLLKGEKLTIQAGGLPLYWDADHLSEAGADYLRELLMPIFETPATKAGISR